MTTKNYWFHPDIYKYRGMKGFFPNTFNTLKFDLHSQTEQRRVC